MLGHIVGEIAAQSPTEQEQLRRPSLTRMPAMCRNNSIDSSIDSEAGGDDHRLVHKTWRTSSTWHSQCPENWLGGSNYDIDDNDFIETEVWVKRAT